MGPRTAYSTFFTVGFMLSMVSTLPRDIVPLSDIFVLGSPRRVVLKLDKALPGEEKEEDREGKMSERNPGTPPPRCGPPPPGKNSALRPGLRSRRVLGEISCTRVADMLHKVWFKELVKFFFVFLKSHRGAQRPAPRRFPQTEKSKWRNWHLRALKNAWAIRPLDLSNATSIKH